jgi:hypothetical protein
VLIMDEPTAGVDAESQDALVRTLLWLVQRGLTLIIVTHEIAPLRPVLTRVVAMSGGRLVGDTSVLRAGIETGSGDHHHDAPLPLGTRGDQESPTWLGPTLGPLGPLGPTLSPTLGPTLGSTLGPGGPTLGPTVGPTGLER